MISFTFPNEGWPAAIRATAEALGMGPSQFATIVFGQAMAAIERKDWNPDEPTWSPDEPVQGPQDQNEENIWG